MSRTLALRSTLRWCVLAALPVLGCSGEEGTGGADPGLTPDPRGQRSLKDSPPAEAYRAMLRSFERAAVGQEVGARHFVAALQKDLATRGIDPTIVASIDADRIGDPMPGGTLANRPPVRRGASSTVRQPLGQLSLALLAKSEFSKYYDCPLLAPEEDTAAACDKMVNGVVAGAKNELDAQADTVAATIKEQFACLSAQAQEFVTAWALEGAEQGVDAAATYAIYELRAAAQCDNKASALAVAYQLGLEQGWSLADAKLATGMAAVGACSTDAPGIVAAMQTAARGTIETFVEQNRTCLDTDLSQANQRLVEVETRRREGITAGIDERIQILAVQIQEAIVTAWSPGGPCAPPPVVVGGGGDGGGDPLVVDLDGDGLALQTVPRAAFDLLGTGEAQRVRWVGPRDALLVIDRDGDGRVGSVHELFGDVGRCGAERCRDGFAALAELDREEAGGNGDGVLDARDRSFGRLRLWLDAQGDGVTQPGELHALADHGIAELPLTGAFAAEGLPQGFVTSRAELTTSRGRRPLVDAWLRLDARAH